MVQVRFKTIDGVESLVEATVGESLMAAAVRNRVPGIEAACGGSMVCGTCHIYVSEPWFGRLPAVSDMEAEIHEYGAHVRANSRLACQITATAALDGIVVTTPVAQR
ncbi:MAG TPA: 2Fe-2S iron-sulfur cluster-binding protein [Caulobacteraceae bacterium]